MNGPEEAGKAIVEGAAGLLPKVYEDGLQESVKEIGSSLHGVVRLALKPVNLAVWSVEQSLEWGARTVADLFTRRKVPEERVQKPAPQLLDGVIRGLQVAGPDPDGGLRDMYAALLATSMDSATADDAHPAFAEVIRQITPDEARILNLIKHQRGFAILQIGYDEIIPSNEDSTTRSESTKTILGRQSGCVRPNSVLTYVENLKRLRIVEEAEDTIDPNLLEKGLTAVMTVEHLQRHPKEYQLRAHEASVAERIADYDDPTVQEFVETMRAEEPTTSNATLVRERFLYVSSLTLTSFGEQFLKACLA